MGVYSHIYEEMCRWTGKGFCHLCPRVSIYHGEYDGLRENWAKEPGSGVDAVQVHRAESPTPLSPVGPRKGRLCYAIRNQYEITRTTYAQHACKITFLHKRGFCSNMTTAREASLKHLR